MTYEGWPGPPGIPENPEESLWHAFLVNEGPRAGKIECLPWDADFKLWSYAYSAEDFIKLPIAKVYLGAVQTKLDIEAIEAEAYMNVSLMLLAYQKEVMSNPKIEKYPLVKAAIKAVLGAIHQRIERIKEGVDNM